MIGKKYAFFTGDDLNIFISWVSELRNEYNTNGVECLKRKYAEYCVLLQTNATDHQPLPLPQDIPNVECKPYRNL